MCLTWEISLSFSFSTETGLILTNGHCKICHWWLPFCLWLLGSSDFLAWMSMFQLFLGLIFLFLLIFTWSQPLIYFLSYCSVLLFFIMLPKKKKREWWLRLLWKFCKGSEQCRPKQNKHVSVERWTSKYTFSSICHAFTVIHWMFTVIVGPWEI